MSRELKARLLAVAVLNASPGGKTAAISMPLSLVAGIVLLLTFAALVSQ